MKSITSEWVTKAEGDFTTASRELRARKSPNYDAVCFHAQQCVEKYLKAVLQISGRYIPKTHNIIELMLLCMEIDNSFEMLWADLVTIERYAVWERYPGEVADKEDAQTAFAGVAILRAFVKHKLKLK